MTGSEQIRVVVRDRETGMVLRDIPQIRDQDYDISYEGGRLLFRAPVSRAVDAAFLAGGFGPTRDILAGHPVYVVVDYERWDRSVFGGDSAGVHARQQIEGVVEIGGGYVDESRENGDFRAWSVEGALTPVDGVRLEVEYAESESGVGMGEISDDGGITWKPFSHRDLRQDDATGDALFVRGTTDFKKAIRQGGGPDVDLEFYYRFQSPGFYSHGSLLEQGTEKYGAQLRWAQDARNRWLIAHDGGLADVATLQGDGFRTEERERTGLKYLHTRGDWQATAEIAHQIWDSTRRPEDEDPIRTVSFAAGGAVEVDKGIDLSLRQELATGGDPTLYKDDGDNATTVAGASFEVAEDLHLTLTERLRWTGEDATAVGFKTTMDDGTSIYVQERMWSIADRDPRDASSVMGASRGFGDSGDERVYAEYQLRGGSSGLGNRALMGTGRRFRVAPGLSLDAAFERSDVQGGIYGNESLNAASVGFEWLGHELFKLSGRYEARVEDRTESLGRNDLIQLVTMNALEAKLHRDASVLGRVNYSETEDRTTGQLEARLLETSVGLAYRPVLHDWFHGLARWSQLVELRPGGLLEDEFHERQTDVFSVNPVIDTPVGLQLVNKFAMRLVRNRTADLDEQRTQSLLTVHRVNYRVLPEVDFGVEYRFLRQFVPADDLEHGVLLETAYIVEDLVRIGGGWNFTRFSDNEFPDRDMDRGGFFFRVTGQY